MTVPIVTGYYRYTDIWFDWKGALPEKDGEYVKAILAHDAITHPDHPLHIEGVEGIKMFIGTFHSGEERLLFSSKQVDYIRYWLHAMKLTESEIPLPYSDCLLTHGDGEEHDLRYVTEVVYKDGGELRGAIKAIDKKNKKTKGSNPSLLHRRVNFKRMQELFQEKKHVFLAIDIESWEREHAMITEFGTSLLRWEGDKEVIEDEHLIVKEYESYRNGQWVEDNRMNYSFGESKTLPKAQFKKHIQSMISQYVASGALFLIFHDATADIKDLKSKMIEAPIDNVSYVLPDTSPDHGIFIVDTADLFAALQGDGSRNRQSLTTICRHLAIKTRFMHNAGNDAHYTLAAFKEMIGSEEIIAQRERRWPLHIQPGQVKIDFPPMEDGELSDEEGLLG